jgi:hypothetical protein
MDCVASFELKQTVSSCIIHDSRQISSPEGEGEGNRWDTVRTLLLERSPCIVISLSIRVGVFLFLVFSVFLSKLVSVMAVQLERSAGLAPRFSSQPRYCMISLVHICPRASMRSAILPGYIAVSFCVSRSPRQRWGR